MDGLLSLLLFAVFAFLMLRGGCGRHVGHGGHRKASEHAERPTPTERKTTGFVDPVCRMLVDADEGYIFKHRGLAFHFCSRGCLDKFESDPELYLSKDAPPPEAAHTGGN